MRMGASGNLSFSLFALVPLFASGAAAQAPAYSEQGRAASGCCDNSSACAITPAAARFLCPVGAGRLSSAARFFNFRLNRAIDVSRLGTLSYLVPR